jgi:glycosyltransferase involved in cell wall biosynthesis
MLGVLAATARGAGEPILSEVTRALQARGLRVVGALQEPADPSGEMRLRLLPAGEVVGISQRLGAGASGCRLDPDGLERAVAAGLARLAAEGADVVIVNKFGKQEAEGRGFRTLIAEALAAGIPVLTSVAPEQSDAFARFAEGLAEPVPSQTEAALAWCLNAAT